jgi:hypothetical protein
VKEKVVGKMNEDVFTVVINILKLFCTMENRQNPAKP